MSCIVSRAGVEPTTFGFGGRRDNFRRRDLVVRKLFLVKSLQYGVRNFRPAIHVQILHNVGSFNTDSVPDSVPRYSTGESSPTAPMRHLLQLRSVASANDRIDGRLSANPTTLSFESRSINVNGKAIVLRESQNQWYLPVGTDLPSRRFRGGLARVVIRREGSITTQGSASCFNSEHHG